MAQFRMKPIPSKNPYPNTSGFLYSVSGSLRDSFRSASFGRQLNGGIFKTSLGKGEIRHIFGSNVNNKEFYYPTFHDRSNKFSVLTEFVKPKDFTDAIVTESKKIVI